MTKRAMYPSVFSADMYQISSGELGRGQRSTLYDEYHICGRGCWTCGRWTRARVWHVARRQEDPDGRALSHRASSMRLRVSEHMDAGQAQAQDLDITDTIDTQSGCVPYHRTWPPRRSTRPFTPHRDRSHRARDRAVEALGHTITCTSISTSVQPIPCVVRTHHPAACAWDSAHTSRSRQLRVETRRRVPSVHASRALSLDIDAAGAASLYPPAWCVVRGGGLCWACDAMPVAARRLGSFSLAGV
ncbi:hypothetical protein C8Q77DRAFT_547518 [Trametes polyzona]|nr:hypothetical protein C8Q77DRAFT_547518 [Trametes polyzona]